MSAVDDALRHSPLLAPADRVVVACSGGPDSLALLHALHALRGELSLTVAAAHLHHGLRGSDADADAAFVEAFCAERAIPCTVGHADVLAFARARKQSVETAAREARYAFLEDTAAQTGANKIVVAHTADDQSETVLFNIVRGAGLDGLRGIPARRGKIVRPLLQVSRTEVEHYCTLHELQPRHDPTNADTQSSTRSRVRHELLPLLETYNAGVREALRRLSQTAGGDADFLHAEANKAFAECVTHTGADSLKPDILTLDAARLRLLHPALMRRVLRAAMQDLRGTGEGVTFAHTETICVALQSGEKACVTVPMPVPCRITVNARTVALHLPPQSAA